MSRRLRSLVDSSDLVQEVHLAARRAGSKVQFENKQAKRGWLLRILQRKAADIARRNHIRTGSEADSTLPAHDQPSPSRMFRDEEDRDRWSKLLAKLPEREREILVLRVVQGLPFRDVAGKLDITEVNARVAFHRSVTRLRQLTSAE